MPTNETPELAAIRQAAQLLTDTRERVGAGPWEMPADVVARLEQVMWSAYTLACEADALREQIAPPAHTASTPSVRDDAGHTSVEA